MSSLGLYSQAAGNNSQQETPQCDVDSYGFDANRDIDKKHQSIEKESYDFSKGNLDSTIVNLDPDTTLKSLSVTGDILSNVSKADNHSKQTFLSSNMLSSQELSTININSKENSFHYKKKNTSNDENVFSKSDMSLFYKSVMGNNEFYDNFLKEASHCKSYKAEILKYYKENGYIPIDYSTVFSYKKNINNVKDGDHNNYSVNFSELTILDHDISDIKSCDSEEILQISRNINPDIQKVKYGPFTGFENQKFFSLKNDDLKVNNTLIQYEFLVTDFTRDQRTECVVHLKSDVDYYVMVDLAIKKFSIPKDTRLIFLFFNGCNDTIFLDVGTDMSTFFLTKTNNRIRILKRDIITTIYTQHFSPRPFVIGTETKVKDVILYLAKMYEIINYQGYALFDIKKIKELDLNKSIPEQVDNFKHLIFVREYFVLSDIDTLNLRAAYQTYVDCKIRFFQNEKVLLSEDVIVFAALQFFIEGNENSIIPDDISFMFPRGNMCGNDLGKELRNYIQKKGKLDADKSVVKFIDLIKNYEPLCSRFFSCILIIDDHHMGNFTVSFSSNYFKLSGVTNTDVITVFYDDVIENRVYYNTLELFVYSKKNRICKYLIKGDSLSISNVLNRHILILRSIYDQKSKIPEINKEKSYKQNLIRLYLYKDDVNYKSLKIHMDARGHTLLKQIGEIINIRNLGAVIPMAIPLGHSPIFIREDDILSSIGIRSSMKIKVIEKYLAFSVSFLNDKSFHLKLDVTRNVDLLINDIFISINVKPVSGCVLFIKLDNQNIYELDNKKPLHDQVNNNDKLWIRKKFFFVNEHLGYSLKMLCIFIYDYIFLIKSGYLSFDKEELTSIWMLFLNITNRDPHDFEYLDNFLPESHDMFGFVESCTKSNKVQIDQAIAVDEFFEHFYRHKNFGTVIFNCLVTYKPISQPEVSSECTLSVNQYCINMKCGEDLDIRLLYEFIHSVYAIEHHIFINYADFKDGTVDRFTIFFDNDRDRCGSYTAIEYYLECYKQKTIGGIYSSKVSKTDICKRLNGGYTDEKGIIHGRQMDFYYTYRIINHETYNKICWIDLNFGSANIIDALPDLPLKIKNNKERYIIFLVHNDVWKIIDNTLISLEPIRRSTLVIHKAFKMMTFKCGKVTKEIEVNISKKVGDVIPELCHSMNVPYIPGMTLYERREDCIVSLYNNKYFPEQTTGNRFRLMIRYFVLDIEDILDESEVDFIFNEMKIYIHRKKVNFDTKKLSVLTYLNAASKKMDKPQYEFFISRKYNWIQNLEQKPILSKKLYNEMVQAFPDICGLSAKRKFISYFSISKEDISIRMKLKNDEEYSSICFRKSCFEICKSSESICKISYMTVLHTYRSYCNPDICCIIYSTEDKLQNELCIFSDFTSLILDTLNDYIFVCNKCINKVLRDENQGNVVILNVIVDKQHERNYSLSINVFQSCNEVLDMILKKLNLKMDDFLGVMKLQSGTHVNLTSNDSLFKYSPKSGDNIYILSKRQKVRVSLVNGFSKEVMMDLSSPISNIISDVAHKFFIKFVSGYVLVKVENEKKFSFNLSKSIIDQDISLTNLFLIRQYFIFSSLDIKFVDRYTFEEVRFAIQNTTYNISQNNATELALYSLYADSQRPDDVKKYELLDIKKLLPNYIDSDIATKIIQNTLKYTSPISQEEAMISYVSLARNLEFFGNSTFNVTLDYQTNDGTHTSINDVILLLGPFGIAFGNDKTFDICSYVSWNYVVSYEYVCDNITLSLANLSGELKNVTIFSDELQAICNILSTFNELNKMMSEKYAFEASYNQEDHNHLFNEFCNIYDSDLLFSTYLSDPFAFKCQFSSQWRNIDIYKTAHLYSQKLRFSKHFLVAKGRSISDILIINNDEDFFNKNMEYNYIAIVPTKISVFITLPNHSVEIQTIKTKWTSFKNIEFLCKKIGLNCALGLSLYFVNYDDIITPTNLTYYIYKEAFDVKNFILKRRFYIATEDMVNDVKSYMALYNDFSDKILSGDVYINFECAIELGVLHFIVVNNGLNQRLVKNINKDNIKKYLPSNVESTDNVFMYFKNSLETYDDIGKEAAIHRYLSICNCIPDFGAETYVVNFISFLRSEHVRCDGVSIVLSIHKIDVIDSNNNILCRLSYENIILIARNQEYCNIKYNNIDGNFINIFLYSKDQTNYIVSYINGVMLLIKKFKNEGKILLFNRSIDMKRLELKFSYFFSLSGHSGNSYEKNFRNIMRNIDMGYDDNSLMYIIFENTLKNSLILFEKELDQKVDDLISKMTITTSAPLYNVLSPEYMIHYRHLKFYNIIRDTFMNLKNGTGHYLHKSLKFSAFKYYIKVMKISALDDLMVYLNYFDQEYDRSQEIKPFTDRIIDITNQCIDKHQNHVNMMLNNSKSYNVNEENQILLNLLISFIFISEKIIVELTEFRENALSSIIKFDFLITSLKKLSDRITLYIKKSVIGGTLSYFAFYKNLVYSIELVHSLSMIFKYIHDYNNRYYSLRESYQSFVLALDIIQKKFNEIVFKKNVQIQKCLTYHGNLSNVSELISSIEKYVDFIRVNHMKDGNEKEVKFLKLYTNSMDRFCSDMLSQYMSCNLYPVDISSRFALISSLSGLSLAMKTLIGNSQIKKRDCYNELLDKTNERRSAVQKTILYISSFCIISKDLLLCTNSLTRTIDQIYKIISDPLSEISDDTMIALKSNGDKLVKCANNLTDIARNLKQIPTNGLYICEAQHTLVDIHYFLGLISQTNDIFKDHEIVRNDIMDTMKLVYNVLVPSVMSEKNFDTIHQSSIIQLYCMLDMFLNCLLSEISECKNQKSLEQLFSIYNGINLFKNKYSNNIILLINRPFLYENIQESYQAVRNLMQILSEIVATIEKTDSTFNQSLVYTMTTLIGLTESTYEYLYNFSDEKPKIPPLSKQLSKVNQHLLNLIKYLNKSNFSMDVNTYRKFISGGITDCKEFLDYVSMQISDPTYEYHSVATSYHGKLDMLRENLLSFLCDSSNENTNQIFDKVLTSIDYSLHELPPCFDSTQKYVYNCCSSIDNLSTVLRYLLDNNLKHDDNKHIVIIKQLLLLLEEMELSISTLLASANASNIRLCRLMIYLRAVDEYTRSVIREFHKFTDDKTFNCICIIVCNFLFKIRIAVYYIRQLPINEKLCFSTEQFIVLYPIRGRMDLIIDLINQIRSYKQIIRFIDESNVVTEGTRGYCLDRIKNNINSVNIDSLYDSLDESLVINVLKKLNNVSSSLTQDSRSLVFYVNNEEIETVTRILLGNIKRFLEFLEKPHISSENIIGIHKDLIRYITDLEPQYLTFINDKSNEVSSRTKSSYEQYFKYLKVLMDTFSSYQLEKQQREIDTLYTKTVEIIKDLKQYDLSWNSLYRIEQIYNISDQYTKSIREPTSIVYTILPRNNVQMYIDLYNKALSILGDEVLSKEDSNEFLHAFENIKEIKSKVPLHIHDSITHISGIFNKENNLLPFYLSRLIATIQPDFCLRRDLLYKIISKITKKVMQNISSLHSELLNIRYHFISCGFSDDSYKKYNYLIQDIFILSNFKDNIWESISNCISAYSTIKFIYTELLSLLNSIGDNMRMDKFAALSFAIKKHVSLILQLDLTYTNLIEIYGDELVVHLEVLRVNKIYGNTTQSLTNKIRNLSYYLKESSRNAYIDYYRIRLMSSLILDLLSESGCLIYKNVHDTETSASINTLIQNINFLVPILSYNSSYQKTSTGIQCSRAFEIYITYLESSYYINLNNTYNGLYDIQMILKCFHYIANSSLSESSSKDLIDITKSLELALRNRSSSSNINWDDVFSAINNTKNIIKNVYDNEILPNTISRADHSNELVDRMLTFSNIFRINFYGININNHVEDSLFNYEEELFLSKDVTKLQRLIDSNIINSQKLCKKIDINSLIKCIKFYIRKGDEIFSSSFMSYFKLCLLSSLVPSIGRSHDTWYALSKDVLSQFNSFSSFVLSMGHDTNHRNDDIMYNLFINGIYFDLSRYDYTHCKDGHFASIKNISEDLVSRVCTELSTNPISTQIFDIFSIRRIMIYIMTVNRISVKLTSLLLFIYELDGNRCEEYFTQNTLYKDMPCLREFIWACLESIYNLESLKKLLTRNNPFSFMLVKFAVFAFLYSSLTFDFSQCMLSSNTSEYYILNLLSNEIIRKSEIYIDVYNSSNLFQLAKRVIFNFSIMLILQKVYALIFLHYLYSKENMQLEKRAFISQSSLKLILPSILKQVNNTFTADCIPKTIKKMANKTRFYHVLLLSQIFSSLLSLRITNKKTYEEYSSSLQTIIETWINKTLDIQKKRFFRRINTVKGHRTTVYTDLISTTLLNIDQNISEFMHTSDLVTISYTLYKYCDIDTLNVDSKEECASMDKVQHVLKNLIKSLHSNDGSVLLEIKNYSNVILVGCFNLTYDALMKLSNCKLSTQQISVRMQYMSLIDSSLLVQSRNQSACANIPDLNLVQKNLSNINIRFADLYTSLLLIELIKHTRNIYPGISKILRSKECILSLISNNSIEKIGICQEHILNEITIIDDFKEFRSKIIVNDTEELIMQQLIIFNALFLILSDGIFIPIPISAYYHDDNSFSASSCKNLLSRVFSYQRRVIRNIIEPFIDIHNYPSYVDLLEDYIVGKVSLSHLIYKLCYLFRKKHDYHTDKTSEKYELIDEFTDQCTLNTIESYLLDNSIGNFNEKDAFPPHQIEPLPDDLSKITYSNVKKNCYTLGSGSICVNNIELTLSRVGTFMTQVYNSSICIHDKICETKLAYSKDRLLFMLLYIFDIMYNYDMKSTSSITFIKIIINLLPEMIVILYRNGQTFNLKIDDINLLIESYYSVLNHYKNNCIRNENHIRYLFNLVSSILKLVMNISDVQLSLDYCIQKLLYGLEINNFADVLIGIIEFDIIESSTEGDSSLTYGQAIRSLASHIYESNFRPSQDVFDNIHSEILKTLKMNYSDSTRSKSPVKARLEVERNINLEINKFNRITVCLRFMKYSSEFKNITLCNIFNSLHVIYSNIIVVIEMKKCQDKHILHDFLNHLSDSISVFSELLRYNNDKTIYHAENYFGSIEFLYDRIKNISEETSKEKEMDMFGLKVIHTIKNSLLRLLCVLPSLINHIKGDIIINQLLNDFNIFYMSLESGLKDTEAPNFKHVLSDFSSIYNDLNAISREFKNDGVYALLKNISSYYKVIISRLITNDSILININSLFFFEALDYTISKEEGSILEICNRVKVHVEKLSDLSLSFSNSLLSCKASRVTKQKLIKDIEESMHNYCRELSLLSKYHHCNFKEDVYMATCSINTLIQCYNAQRISNVAGRTKIKSTKRSIVGSLNLCKERIDRIISNEKNSRNEINIQLSYIASKLLNIGQKFGLLVNTAEMIETSETVLSLLTVFKELAELLYVSLTHIDNEKSKDSVIQEFYLSLISHLNYSYKWSEEVLYRLRESKYVITNCLTPIKDILSNTADLLSLSNHQKFKRIFTKIKIILKNNEKVERCETLVNGFNIKSDDELLNYMELDAKVLLYELLSSNNE